MKSSLRLKLAPVPSSELPAPCRSGAFWRVVWACVLVCASASVAEAKTRITYWDKWTGFERDAMRALVDDFNASQPRIHVEFMAISDIVQKMLLATAAGVPPDVAGVWAANVVEYADKHALMSLDELARGTIVNRERYLRASFAWQGWIPSVRLARSPSSTTTRRS